MVHGHRGKAGIHNRGTRSARVVVAALHFRDDDTFTARHFLAHGGFNLSGAVLQDLL